MRIIFSQQNLPAMPAHAGQTDKKILVTFELPGVVDSYSIDKSEDFLAAIDKFIKKHRMNIAVFKKAGLKFVNTGLLTERITRSIIAGLNFNTE